MDGLLELSSLPSIDVRPREESLWKALDAHGIEALYVDNLAHVRWLTGFSGSAGAALVVATNKTIHLLTDSRYRDQSREELQNVHSSAEVHMARASSERIDVASRVSGSSQVAMDGGEVSYSFHAEFAEKHDVNVLPGRTPFVELRRVKDDAEIARMRVAARIADLALQEVVDDGMCGLTERDVRLRLEYSMARHGADAPSFDTIVATGANAALPHHSPSPSIVEPHHMVIIDMGALVDGYHSDMTRTVCVGDISDDDAHLLTLVRQSQAAGLKSVKAGERASLVDAACRATFEAAGVLDLYSHGTGHGVGLDIHEEPFFHRAADQTLMSNEVVTVEPGLYRVGVSGVRIEDLVVVTNSGCQILTNTPKELSCPPSPRMI